MHRQSKFAQQHLSRRLVRQRKYDPPNFDIADLAAWAEGEVVIIGHCANGGSVDLGYVAGDCLRSCRLSASQQCGDTRLPKIADPPLQKKSRRPMPLSYEMGDMIFLRCHTRRDAPTSRYSAIYSITSSARASSDGGTVRPSSLAVLRLTASS